MPSVRSYRSPKTEVRESSKEGKGVFAKEDIKKGETVFVKAGHIVAYDEMVELEAELGEYSLQISDNLFLCPKTEKEVKDMAIFVNHSCEPNVGPQGQITFVAMRAIKKGEELCYDYAMTTARPYEMECNCGSENCRKVITGKDWKLKGLQEKYRKHFTSLIIRKISGK